MSIGHIVALFLIAAWTGAVCLAVGKRPGKGKTAAKIMGLLMLLSELLRDGILVSRGEFTVGYLPLHLCSFGMGLCLLYGFRGKNRGSLLCLLSLPGSICALLYPNWGSLSLAHFISLHGYFFHALLLQGSLLPLVTGQLRLKIEDLRQTVLFLILSACVVGPCNLLLGTNYMFLRWPSPDSPLEYLTRIPGPFGYQLGLFFLSAGVIFMVWAVIILFQRRCKIYKDF